MKILCISDRHEPGLYDYWDKNKTKDIGMILSAGDLDPQYLEFLVTMVNVPLLYIRGNHDTIYDNRPPLGCDNVDDRLVICKGLRILGFGGSYRYRNSPDMYDEKEMARRIKKTGRLIRKAGGFDILLTHAPAYGYGDRQDIAHRGFACFNDLLNRYHPRYMIHGHIHSEYGSFSRTLVHESGALIINACGQYRLEIND